MFNHEPLFLRLRPVLGAQSRDLGFQAAFKARSAVTRRMESPRLVGDSADREAIDRLVALGWTRARTPTHMVHVSTGPMPRQRLAPSEAQLRRTPRMTNVEARRVVRPSHSVGGRKTGLIR